MHNERPADPEWVALADKLTEDAAKALNAFVVVVAAQEGGKLGVSIGGDRALGPETQSMVKAIEDYGIEGFLHLLAHKVGETEKAKDMKLVFEPGAFDDFEGTPEELQDVLAQLHQSMADGTLLARSTPMSEEEQADIERRVAEAAKRRARPM